MGRPRATYVLGASVALLLLVAPLLIGVDAPAPRTLTQRDIDDAVVYSDCPPDLARCNAPAGPAPPQPEWRTLTTRSFVAAPGLPVEIAFHAPMDTVTFFVNLTFEAGGATGVALSGPGACTGDYGAALGDGTTWSIDCARGGGGNEAVTLSVQAGLVRGEALVAALVCPPQRACPGPGAGSP